MARVDVKGISQRIDGCERLLYKQSNQFYQRLAPEHRSFIDPEDILQESLIAAWKAEQTYSNTWGSSDNAAQPGKRAWSTYMAYGVRNQFTAAFASPLSQAKRLSLDGVASLHSIVPGSEDLELGELIPDPAIGADAIQVGIGTFCTIGRRLKGDSAALFVAVFCLGQWPIKALGGIRRLRLAVTGIRKAAIAVGGFEQMVNVSASNYFRKKTLTSALEFTNMRTSNGDAVKILDCIGCRGLFSLRDVRRGKFFAETLTCLACYRKMQASVPEKSCFGKIKTAESEGYDPDDVQCRLHCMDRSLCKKFIEGEGTMAKAAAVEEIEDEVGFENGEEDALDGLEDDNDGGDEGEDDAPVQAKSTKKKAKTGKATKPAAKAEKTSKTAKKAVKAAKPALKRDGTDKPAKERKRKPREIKLDETTGLDLPFKPNSGMRYCLVQALQKGGIKVKALEASLTKGGFKVPFQMKMLRSGKSNGNGLLPYPVTHTWNIHEEGGMIKATGVKRIATYAKLERVYASGGKKSKKK